MNRINSLNAVIEYMEENLTEDIDIAFLAKKCGMSIYEFRRIFAFASGVSISEYIRKRRLSLAAEELLSGNIGVTEAAVKYGYEDVSSFSRAFKTFHGFSPNRVSDEKSRVKMFTRIGFDFALNGGPDIAYTVRERESFCIAGISGLSGASDTECCEKVWADFYGSSHIDEILNLCGGKIVSAYENDGNDVRCTIGAQIKRENVGKVDFPAVLSVPAARWAVFEMRGSDDAVTNRFYNDVIFRWLESSRFRRDRKIPNIEVFPENMDDENFVWQIEIPLVD